MEPNWIYKIVPEAIWQAAVQRGVFEGAGIDLTDGYIHFSTGEQARETAEKHFAGQRDLLLVAVSIEFLPPEVRANLRFEPSRGGALFPHLYGSLPTESAAWVKPLPWLETDVHQFPELS